MLWFRVRPLAAFLDFNDISSATIHRHKIPHKLFTLIIIVQLVVKGIVIMRFHLKSISLQCSAMCCSCQIKQNLSHSSPQEHDVSPHCSAWQCVLKCRFVVYCSMLQRVSVCSWICQSLTHCRLHGGDALPHCNVLPKNTQPHILRLKATLKWFITALQCIAMCCSVLRCCRVLPCVLQCAVVYCIIFRIKQNLSYSGSKWHGRGVSPHSSEIQCAVVCCSVFAVWNRVVACHSVLQWNAMCCGAVCSDVLQCVVE